MNTQVHDTTKQTPYELVSIWPTSEGNFCSDVNFREQLDEDVLKPCDREISEEETKDKEQEDEGNEEEDEEIAKDSGDVDKNDGEEEDEDNLVDKEMEGTYMGTVARELQSNIEERNKTTAASDLSVYQYSVDSEKCDGHDSDRDENGNNNVQVKCLHICFDPDLSFWFLSMYRWL
eukprot:Em0004g1536a